MNYLYTYLNERFKCTINNKYTYIRVHTKDNYNKEI